MKLILSQKEAIVLQAVLEGNGTYKPTGKSTYAIVGELDSYHLIEKTSNGWYITRLGDAILSDYRNNK